MPQIKNTSIKMLYGTAWKKDRTAKLVSQALQAGFRAIDTAGQPRHYQEHLVGEGVRTFLATSNLRREDLYLQTKYTSIGGQDPNNLPYDASASITDQVKASITSSLHNLRHSDSDKDAYIDCVLLHSPLPTLDQTLEAWTALSSFVPARVRSLGISNVTLPLLQVLCQHSTIKPAAVQNRFYAATNYDVALRKFCRENGIEYQSFWTLTGNPKLLRSSLVDEAERKIGVSAEVVVYGLVESIGVVPINGTTSHIESDLNELQKLEQWKSEKGNGEIWEQYVQGFEKLLRPAFTQGL